MTKRETILYRYSPYSVDRNIDPKKIIKLFNGSLIGSGSFTFEAYENQINFFYRLDNWESEYFGVKSMKILFIDYQIFDLVGLKQAVKLFLNYLREKYGENIVLSMEIPAEDINIIQLLNEFSFKMIETRLHFLNNNLHSFNWDRFPVRQARDRDISNLKKVASEMRNDFDRFHADWSFDNTKADNYLSTYIENSIKGFADIVLVPNQKEIPSDSFLTANILKEDWKQLDYKISKMVLSAVSSSTNRGWYVKLISEMTFILKELGTESIFMNTQATNIAVVATWEKLGYRFGRATHLLTKHF